MCGQDIFFYLKEKHQMYSQDIFFISKEKHQMYCQEFFLIQKLNKALTTLSTCSYINLLLPIWSKNYYSRCDRLPYQHL